MIPNAALTGKFGFGRGLKIFIDFWDVVNAARNQSDRFQVEINWERFVTSVIHHSYSDHSTTVFDHLAGCYIFVVMPPSDQPSKDFALRTLRECGAAAGLYFDFIFLPEQEMLEPSGAAAVGAGLAVEMIKHAALGQHDHLALVSNRPGFLPLFRYLRDEGQRVVHIATGAPDEELRANSWRQVELRLWLAALCDIDHDNTVTLVGRRTETTEQEIRDLLDEPTADLEIIDLSDPSALTDKDLFFTILNRRLYLRNTETGEQYSGFYPELALELREGLGDGSIVGHLPYVMRHGRSVIYSDGEGGWVRAVATDA